MITTPTSPPLSRHRPHVDVTARLKALVVIVLLTLGVYVRFADLSTHFTHVDDIGVAVSLLDAKHPVDIASIRQHIERASQNGSSGPKGALLQTLDHNGLLEPFLRGIQVIKPLWVVPVYWTYAPLQFVLTSFLVHPEQTYQEKLFWGRFPSFLVGCLGLVLMLLFHRRLHGERWFAYGLLSMTLLAFSWESIIYSQQMESYSIGVASALGLALLLHRQLEKRELSRRDALVNAVLLAVLSHAQYQMLFLIPAFYGTLLLRTWLMAPDRARGIRSLALGAIGYAAMVLPMVVLFLLKQVSKGVNWNAGPNGEFLFTLPAGAPWIAQGQYAVGFFAANLLGILQSNLAFIPEQHAGFGTFSAVSASLLMVGLASLARSADPTKRYFLVFLSMSAATWVVLIVAQKLTLSPTRHSLILLPFMAILVSEGFGFLARGATRLHCNGPALLSVASCGLIAVMFFAQYPEVRQERRNPITEFQVADVLERYQVRRVFSYAWTWDLDLMHLPGGVWQPYLPNNEGDRYYELAATSPRPQEPIAFVGREALSEENFERAIAILNNSGARLPVQWGDYSLVYREELPSDIEVEFLKRTWNFPSGFYWYIFIPRATLASR